MSVLWSEDRLSQSELALRLGVKASTITVSLRALEKSGLVVRSRDSEDQRVVRVKVTRKGHEIKDQVTDAWAELERRTLEGLGKAEVREFDRIASQITSQLSS